MSRGRISAAYLLFVGVPLVGVLGVLRAGRGLIAPPAISGLWELSFDAPGDGFPCRVANEPGHKSTVAISQSGSDLLLRPSLLPGVTLRASASPSGIRTSETVFEGDPDCGSVSLRMEMDVIDEANRRTLRGELVFPGCPACRPTRFVATRVESRGAQR